METQGKRVYPQNEDEALNLKSGEYYLSNNGYVFFCLPNGDSGFIASANKGWKIVENVDKTITVSSSINMVGRWHGYLINGAWREC